MERHFFDTENAISSVNWKPAELQSVNRKRDIQLSDEMKAGGGIKSEKASSVLKLLEAV